MDRVEIEQHVNKVMHEGFEIPMDNLKPDATLFGDLELDSLDAVDMLVYLEEKFAVKVDGEIFKEATTLKEVYDIVGKLAKESKFQA